MTYSMLLIEERIFLFCPSGKTVVVHCNGGKGRSATVIVATLIALGQTISNAIKIIQRFHFFTCIFCRDASTQTHEARPNYKITRVRKGTIRNPLQQAYLRKYVEFTTPGYWLQKHLILLTYIIINVDN